MDMNPLKCQYIFKKGGCKGLQCGTKPRGESNFCSIHKPKTSSKESSKKESPKTLKSSESAKKELLPSKIAQITKSTAKVSKEAEKINKEIVKIMNTKVLKNVFKSKEAVHHAKQVINDTLLEVQEIAKEVQTSIQNVQTSAREVRQLNRNAQKTIPKEPRSRVQKAKPEYLHCSVCLTAKVNKVLTSCGHTFCKNCIPHFNSRCAICRTSFSNYNVITIYL